MALVVPVLSLAAEQVSSNDQIIVNTEQKSAFKGLLFAFSDSWIPKTQTPDPKPVFCSVLNVSGQLGSVCGGSLQLCA